MRRMSEGCEPENFGKFYSKLIEFSKTSQDKPDFQKSINNINGWVNEQREKKCEEKVQKVGEVLKTTVYALQKFKTGNPYDVTCGALEIISSVAAVAGGPYGVAFSALCSIAGAIVASNRPSEPSVVEQLANVVHGALNNFHNKLQGAELNGLQGRVQCQVAQLREMKVKKELDDEDLWSDYNHFMGMLQSRVNCPLPFKHEQYLQQDADLKDYVRAVEMYCGAYTCFMALLTKARSTFQEVGDSSDTIDKVNRFSEFEKSRAKETFAFLSDKKYLKFIGRLPSEGGRLTKILLLTRNPTVKQVVEKVRITLELPRMADSDEVEKAVEKVSSQTVRFKFPKRTLDLLSEVDLYPSLLGIGSATRVLFINETDFPIRIVSGTVGWQKGNLEFREDVDPHSQYEKKIWTFSGLFSTGGYIKIANKEQLSSTPADDDPNEADVRLIEFAMSSPYALPGKINIQDVTHGERTRGKAAYDNMTDDGGKTLYWKKKEVHYLARAEMLRPTGGKYRDFFNLRKINPIPFTSNGRGTWCFLVQDFDPDKDVIEEEK